MDWAESRRCSAVWSEEVDEEEDYEEVDTMMEQEEVEECKKCCFKTRVECCSSFSSSFSFCRTNLFSSSFCCIYNIFRRHGSKSYSQSVWDNCRNNSGPGRPSKKKRKLLPTSLPTGSSYSCTNSQSSKWSKSTFRHFSSKLSFSSLIFSVILFITCSSALLNFSEACSSRSAPRPRPLGPTTRPNITFQTYACPEAYARWYCLNGATCFSVRIGESILYNCECADGFMGQRCEFKDLDGSYLPSRERLTVAQAGVCGGVVVALLFAGLFIAILKREEEERRIVPVTSNC